MQYYVTFSDDGNILGFYLEGLHPNIPSSAIPITMEQWELYSEDASLYRLDKDRTTIRAKTQAELDSGMVINPPTKTVEEELEELKQLVGDLAALLLEV